MGNYTIYSKTPQHGQLVNHTSSQEQRCLLLDMMDASQNCQEMKRLNHKNVNINMPGLHRLP